VGLIAAVPNDCADIAEEAIGARDPLEPALAQRGWVGRHSARQALKRPTAGSDRSEQGGQSGTGPMPIPNNEKDRGRALNADDIEVRQLQHQRPRFGSAYVAA
jgi:hypothetical protein